METRERPRPGIRVACCVSRLEHHGSHSCPVQRGGTRPLSLFPYPLSLSLSPGFYRVFAKRSASGDTLKSHEICRATLLRLVPSIPADESTRLHPRRQKAYSLVLEAVRYVYLSLPLPTARERPSARAFRFCEIFRRSLCRASATAGRDLAPRLLLRREIGRRCRCDWEMSL